MVATNFIYTILIYYIFRKTLKISKLKTVINSRFKRNLLL